MSPSKLTSLEDMASHCPITSCAFQFLNRDPKYDDEKPYYFSGPLEEGQEQFRTNLEYNTHDNIEVRDIRTIQELINLDSHGFQLFENPSEIDLASPSDAQLHQYIEAITEHLKHELEAEVVMCYNYRFRREQKVGPSDANFRVGRSQNQDKPVLVPHTDQTMEGGPRRVRHHLTEEEANEYLDGNWRVRILNCWRPLFNSADERPLAMCDYNLVDYQDLRAADRASREYVGEIYYLHFNPKQKWYWFSGQMPNELLTFVNYDSDSRGGPPFMPHSSFVNQTLGKSTKPRQSLEMAMIVISKK